MTTPPFPGDDDALLAMDEYRIDVTNADIRAAKQAWLGARDGAESAVRVEQLRWSYGRLVRTQAQQIAEEFRAARGTRPEPTTPESRA